MNIHLKGSPPIPPKAAERICWPGWLSKQRGWSVVARTSLMSGLCVFLGSSLNHIFPKEYLHWGLSLIRPAEYLRNAETPLSRLACQIHNSRVSIERGSITSKRTLEANSMIYYHWLPGQLAEPRVSRKHDQTAQKTVGRCIPSYWWADKGSLPRLYRAASLADHKLNRPQA